MSSIYDALKKIQERDAPLSHPIITHDVYNRPWLIRIVLIAVIMSSVCTVGLIYGLRAFDKKKEAVTDKPANIVQQEIEKAPKLDDLLKQADRFERAKNTRGAIELYSKILTINPDYVDAYIKLGGLYYGINDYEKALTTYTKGLRYFKSDARLLNNIGSVLLAKGELEKAIPFFNESRKVSNEYVEPIYNLACAYARMADKSAAIAALKDACSLQPRVRQWAAKDPDLQNLRGDSEFDAMVEAR